MDDERLAMLVLKNLIELTKTKVLVLLMKKLDNWMPCDPNFYWET